MNIYLIGILFVLGIIFGIILSYAYKFISLKIEKHLITKGAYDKIMKQDKLIYHDGKIVDLKKMVNDQMQTIGKEVIQEHLNASVKPTKEKKLSPQEYFEKAKSKAKSKTIKKGVKTKHGENINKKRH